jgi:hypothetical protein
VSIVISIILGKCDAEAPEDQNHSKTCEWGISGTGRCRRRLPSVPTAAQAGITGDLSRAMLQSTGVRTYRGECEGGEQLVRSEEYQNHKEYFNLISSM